MPQDLLKIDSVELQDIDIPEALRGSLERHVTNLARFTASLRSAGMSDAQIEAGVAAIVESYKIELCSAIRSLREQGHV